MSLIYFWSKEKNIYGTRAGFINSPIEIGFRFQIQLIQKNLIGIATQESSKALNSSAILSNDELTSLNDPSAP